MTLPTRPLGQTKIRLTEIGFGAASLGNLNRRIDDATGRAAIDAAIAAGVGFVDTAPFYGRGLSERRVGDALREADRAIILSTKVGRLLTPDASATAEEARDGFLSPMPFRVVYDYSRDGILRSFEASLHRLGLDRVDMLFVHDIGRMVQGDAHDRHWAELTTGGGFDALESLRDQGAIGAFGLGVNEVEVCIDAIQAAPIDVLLLANRYTLLEQTPLDTVSAVREERRVGDRRRTVQQRYSRDRDAHRRYALLRLWPGTGRDRRTRPADRGRCRRVAGAAGRRRAAIPACPSLRRQRPPRHR